MKKCAFCLKQICLTDNIESIICLQNYSKQSSCVKLTLLPSIKTVNFNSITLLP